MCHIVLNKSGGGGVKIRNGSLVIKDYVLYILSFEEFEESFEGLGVQLWSSACLACMRGTQELPGTAEWHMLVIPAS